MTPDSHTHQKRGVRSAAGVVPVYRNQSGEWCFLLLRAYRYWDFPKGGVNGGEVPFEAAKRELEEETGLSLEDVEFNWQEDFVETEPYAQGKVARYYVAEVKSPEKVYLPLSAELGRPEHHEFRWVGASEARAMLGPRLQRVLEWALRRITN